MKIVGSFKDPFGYTKSGTPLRIGIFRFDNQKAVSQAEIRYNYEKQKLADQLAYEQQLVEQQLRSERHIYLLIGSFLLVILAFLFISKNRRDRVSRNACSCYTRLNYLRSD